MKNAGIILLTFLISFIAFRDLITVANFYWNQEYIANELCVNRDTMAMCYGSCYLSDVLEENKEQQESAPNANMEKQVFNLAIPNAPSLSVQQTVYMVGLVSNSDAFYSFSYLHDIFHPPRLS